MKKYGSITETQMSKRVRKYTTRLGECSQGIAAEDFRILMRVIAAGLRRDRNKMTEACAVAASYETEVYLLEEENKALKKQQRKKK